MFAVVPGCSKAPANQLNMHVGCSLLFAAVLGGLVYWLVYTTSLVKVWS
jgi:hypothetical protein